MLYWWGILFTPSRQVVWRFFSSQPKLVLTLGFFSQIVRPLKNAWNSNCSSSNWFDPNLMTMTKMSAGFSATLCRTSSLFEGPPRCRSLQFLRTVVLFFVLLVDCEEWFCSLAGSLPGARRAIVCILFSLEQSQVVD